jgi:signal transduction histidine kinase
VENPISASELKLRSIVQHAFMGIIEIDRNGYIANINISGKGLFLPLFQFLNISSEEFYPVADYIDPKIAATIKAFNQPNGVIMANEIYHFSFHTGNELKEKDFKFTVSKMFEDCVMMSIEDVTLEIAKEKARKQAEVDKAVAQSKFEIASEVLHDIGNAVVGFGSYLTRIKRLMEENPQANLQNVAIFIKSQETAFSQAIGAPKAGALVKMVAGIAKNQKENQEEIKRSITEQLNIITHIQDILNIQRQYVVGHETQERQPVNLRTILYDCRAMVYASVDKKDIELVINVPAEPLVIRGDRTKLMQVILNILKNSIEAIELDAIKKNITIDLSSQNHVVSLIIRDTGKGFDEATGASLFERGYTTKSSGTGLGLYSCRSIIESHSGVITIQSDGPDYGAVTSILFKN